MVIATKVSNYMFFATVKTIIYIYNVIHIFTYVNLCFYIFPGCTIYNKYINSYKILK